MSGRGTDYARDCAVVMFPGEMTEARQPTDQVAWYALPAADAARRLGVEPDQGLGLDEVQRRLAAYGPNELPTDPPPSRWAIARGQLVNPMNVMLLIAGGVSLAIGQVATAIVVLALVAFNVLRRVLLSVGAVV